jgi:hypothetical protein
VGFDVFLEVYTWFANRNATQILVKAGRPSLVQRFRRTCLASYSKCPICEECRFRNVKSCSLVEIY